MMKWNSIKIWLGAGLMAASVAALAEDTDVFYEMTPPGDKPSVLFVLDNAANFSASAPTCTYVDGTTPSLNGSAGGIEQCALYNAISQLLKNADGKLGVRLGFMAFNANAIRDVSGVHCDGDNGGCLMVPLSDDKDFLLAWIKSWKTNESDKTGFNIKTNRAATAATMQEAWAYYTGGTGISGRNYASVKPVPSCLKSFVVFVGNAWGTAGKPSDSADSTAVQTTLIGAPGVTAAQKALIGGTYTNSCGTATLGTDPIEHASKGWYADEWARYMYQNNEIVSYTVGLVGDKCSAEYPALLQNMADVGGGIYFQTDGYKELEAVLQELTTRIMAVSSAFASASLPVSVNTQGTYLNQVFIGMFRPSINPRWGGNIKQYKFQAYTAAGGGYDLRLVDAKGDPAINKETGFISQCARSFWTPEPVSDDTYWNYDGSKVKGSCSADTAWADSPDGDVVEKGGAGYMLRRTDVDPVKRTVYTCTGTCTALSELGTSTDLDKWVRGADVKDEDGDKDVTEVRPSAHGDVVHSRPVAVDYGGNTGVVVYYGANDGMLHALAGSQTDGGNQLWSFLAPEQQSKLERIYNNSPVVPFPSTGVNGKPYFFDGAVVADQRGENVWIYATQRRGGRMMYAFDVTAPSDPKLRWSAGCTDAGVCTHAAYANIGQTWSAPRIMTAAGYEGGEKPLLIMGGGYDTCEDAEPNTCTSPKGNRIYVIDARTGAVQKTFNTDRSVAADVTVVENPATGHADYAYAADTGGNVYRITFGLEGSAGWTITKIAALGCDAPSAAGTCPAGVLNRKFLFKPEVVVTGSYNAVLVGSGDREHPLPTHLATTVDNYFFMLKDNPLDNTWLSSETTNCTGEVLCLDSLWPISNSGNTTLTLEQLNQKKGWYMALSDNEQVVTSAIVVFGDTTFSTHIPTVPDPNSCTSSLGTARVYNLRYLTGAAVQPGAPYAKVTGGGLSPSPVSGMVTVTNPTTGQPMTVPFVIGGDASSALEGKIKTGSTGVAGSRERVYWYIEQ